MNDHIKLHLITYGNPLMISFMTLLRFIYLTKEASNSRDLLCLGGPLDLTLDQNQGGSFYESSSLEVHNEFESSSNINGYESDSSNINVDNMEQRISTSKSPEATLFDMNDTHSTDSVCMMTNDSSTVLVLESSHLALLNHFLSRLNSTTTENTIDRVSNILIYSRTCHVLVYNFQETVLLVDFTSYLLDELLRFFNLKYMRSGSDLEESNIISVMRRIHDNEIILSILSAHKKIFMITNDLKDINSLFQVILEEYNKSLYNFQSVDETNRKIKPLVKRITETSSIRLLTLLLLMKIQECRGIPLSNITTIILITFVPTSNIWNTKYKIKFIARTISTLNAAIINQNYPEILQKINKQIDDLIKKRLKFYQEKDFKFKLTRLKNAIQERRLDDVLENTISNDNLYFVFGILGLHSSLLEDFEKCHHSEFWRSHEKNIFNEIGVELMKRTFNNINSIRSSIINNLSFSEVGSSFLVENLIK